MSWRVWNSAAAIGTLSADFSERNGLGRDLPSSGANLTELKCLIAHGRAHLMIRRRQYLNMAALTFCFALAAKAATPIVGHPLAFPWGTGERQVQADYPPAPDPSGKYRYRGPLELMGERMEGVVIRFVISKNKGLQQVKVSMPPDNWRRLVASLEREYGKARYGYTRANRVFTHYLEWNAEEVGITASISTIGEDLNATQYAHYEGTIAFAQGSMRVSAIDLIEKSRIDAKLVQEQIPLSNQNTEKNSVEAPVNVPR